MQSNNKDASETIRLQLNKIPEKDQNGNYTRFDAQLFLWFLGCIAESSTNTRTRLAGIRLRKGAENSFADYVGQKILEKIQKLFE